MEIKEKEIKNIFWNSWLNSANVPEMIDEEDKNESRST